MQLKKAHDRKAHHGRRADDNSLCVADIPDLHFGDIFGHEADLALISLGSAVNRQDQVQSLVPSLEVVPKEHIGRTAEAYDHMLVFRSLRFRKSIDHAADRGYARAARDDNHFTILIEGSIKAISVGSPQKKGLSLAFFKNFSRDASDLTDGQPRSKPLGRSAPRAHG